MTIENQNPMSDVSLTPFQIATRRHRDADMLRSGQYCTRTFNGWRGCSIGCLVHDLEPSWENINSFPFNRRIHDRVALEYLDGQTWFAYLQDIVFERLGKEDRINWHVDVSDAVASRGRGWTKILHAIHIAILQLSCESSGPEGIVNSAIKIVIDLHKEALREGIVLRNEWEKVALAKKWEDAKNKAERTAVGIALNYCTAAQVNALGSAIHSTEWRTEKTAAKYAFYTAIYTVGPDIRDEITIKMSKIILAEITKRSDN